MRYNSLFLFLRRDSQVVYANMILTNVAKLVYVIMELVKTLVAHLYVHVIHSAPGGEFRMVCDKYRTTKGYQIFRWKDINCKILLQTIHITLH